MNVTIDGKVCEFQQGDTILQVATKNNIYIPRLCNLEDLAPYGGCRLCIVRILNAQKPFQTACSTPVMNGMEIITIDDELQEMRREVLQLILSEHPSGCLVCSHNNACEESKGDTFQKSGRVFGCFTCPNKDKCELRDIVNYLGINDVDYDFVYKNFPLEREDPFFDRDYNLCILCGRCVRVCNEMRGIGAINLMHRGRETKISTGGDVLHINSNCTFCGSCVDVCPTGALSSKNTKWVKRSNDKTSSVCGFCSVGCGFDYYTIDEELMESVPSKEDPVNRGQACVIGRFCTPPFVNSKARLKYPMIRKNNDLIPCKWEEAYQIIKEKLLKYTPEEIAILVSPDLTNESVFVLKKFGTEILKTPNIALSTLFIPIIGYNEQSFDDIPKSQWILLLNTNVQLTHPILLIRLKQAKDNGAKILALNIGEVDLPFETRILFDIELNLSLQDATSILVAMLGTQNKILLRNLGLKIDESVLERYHLTQFVELRRYQIGTILMGENVTIPPLYMRNLQKLILRLASEGESKISCIGLWNRSNLYGASKFISKTYTEIQEDIKTGKIKALYTTERVSLLDIEKLELLIVQDSFQSRISEKANIVLPASCITEQSGHSSNAELRVREFHEVAAPIGISKPDWMIITQLSEVFDRGNAFRYINSKEIFDEINKISDEIRPDLDFMDIRKIPIDEQNLEFKLADFQYRAQKFAQLVPDLQFLINERGPVKEPKLKSDSVPELTEFSIVQIEEIVPNVFKLVVHAPLIAKKAKPGNFVILMTDETSERVPITLSDWDTDLGTITFFFQERGFSTKELSEVRVGEHLHSVVGPLGNPIELPKDKTILLGGGCYGMGALFSVAKAAKTLGNKVIVIMEGKSKEVLYLRDEYEKLVDKVIYVTSDGSHGIKGNEHGKITTGIEILSQSEKVDVAYFVGCKMMMMEASNATKLLHIPTYVSLDTIMLDGTGMCGACRLTLIEDGKQVTKFACVDGPVFDGHKIDWDELMKRATKFEHEEITVYRSNVCKAIAKFTNKQEDFQ